MANFEAFHWGIKLRINLLFLKSDMSLTNLERIEKLRFVSSSNTDIFDDSLKYYSPKDYEYITHVYTERLEDM